MAYDPCETWHPFQLDANRNISFIATPQPEVLSVDENEKLDKYLFETKKSDFCYLHSHPEIKGVITFVLSELVKNNPLYIKKFCSELFQHYNGECLRQIVEGILSQKINDDRGSSSDKSSTIIINETDSNSEEIADGGEDAGSGVRF